MKRNRFIVGGLAALLLQQAAFASPPNQGVADIEWESCGSAINDDTALNLGSRVQCGTLSGPIDHLRPELGQTELGLVRITAEKPAMREGTIFFSPGGPGQSPVAFLPEIVEYWGLIEPDDVIHGDKKRLAERYDFVGVVPRGLPGTQLFNCSPEPGPYNVLASDLSAGNLHAADQAARDLGFQCSRDPFHWYINSEQAVYDMDLVRRSLNEPKLNFYGVSYGTWLGSWYGAMLPGNVGRMLLDSSMDFTGSFDDAVLAAAQEKHRRFLRLAVKPAIAQPHLYGLGNNEEAIVERFGNLPQRARAEWATRVTSPEALAAALTMAEWVRAEPLMAKAAFTMRVEAHTFSPVRGINIAIKSFANELVHMYYGDNPEAAPLTSPEGLSVYMAVRCNDTASRTEPDYWNGVARENAQRYPGGSGNEAFNLCGYWGTRVTRRPSMEPLHSAGKILMIQAEHDVFTPLTNATKALNVYNNAHMVIARNMSGHGIFGQSDTPCVEKAAGRYLLTGQVPADKLSGCDFVREGAGERSGRSAFSNPERARVLRTYLRRNLGNSL